MIILFQGSQKHSFKISYNAVVQKRRISCLECVSY